MTNKITKLGLVAIICLMALTMFGCEIHEKQHNHKIEHIDKNILCIEGVQYYVHKVYHGCGITVLFDRYGNVMWCDNTMEGEN
ncbi:MAG: hypothetical protein IJS50_03255 [Desulfovibrio sp.]|nr:hypothetical protein [Desulfovibrio sp.]